MSRICPPCAAEMQRAESRAEVIEYEGESLTVTDLSGWFCPACEEAIFDDESAHRYAAAGDTLIAKAQDNPDLPVDFVRDLLIARAEGREAATPFIPEGKRTKRDPGQ